MAIDFVLNKSYSYILPVGHEKVPVASFLSKDLLKFKGFIDIPSGSILEYVGTQHVSLYGNECPIFLYKQDRVALPPSLLNFLFRINTKVKKRR